MILQLPVLSPLIPGWRQLGIFLEPTRMEIVLCLVPYKRSGQVSLQPCWCGVEGNARYGAETFDAVEANYLEIALRRY